MKNFSSKIFCFFLLVIFTGCATKKSPDEFFSEQLTTWNNYLTKVVISDVLTPPVCSRVYAYTNIAAHEALAPGFANSVSYGTRLNGLGKVPVPEGNKEDYYFPLSSIVAFSTVAQKVVFNSEAIKNMEDKFLADVENVDIDEDVYKRSVEYGRTVGNFIIQWASADGYLQRNSNPGFIVTKDNWRWQPTPPDYMDAVEPSWHTLRPFILDSASQFRPVKPDLYDGLPTSTYNKSVMQVYEAVNRKDTEQVAIAKFWDCNPNISVTQGHVMYFQQKISPGGHWLTIAMSVLKNKKADMMKCAEVLSKLAITIADGFINCWEAKYHYNTVRPETVINKYIDPNWRPLLQTPPFPEYPSGHSVVSGASATILTNIFGDNFAYTDSTELPFGMPPRDFKSFNDAAREASMSRMYGGIHYLPSLDNGLVQGRKLAEYVIAKLSK
ncbi:MAG: vanadium-dependent haloperoxidase [Chitinophagaceae bacterium]|nr:vanadium-dependent haloperoxidase [Chitinophagaceae bacterium]